MANFGNKSAVICTDFDRGGRLTCLCYPLVYITSKILAIILNSPNLI